MWYFKTIEQGIPERNPREAEFFRLTSPSEAVVREFIQNSLDARKNQEPIEVRISFKKISRNAVSQFMDDTLKSHMSACGLWAAGREPEEIPCLIVEDFGTTGLDGPVESDAGEGNHYNFWWREGISQKEGQRGGRWGLGKTTFYITSQIRTLWGLTVRNDGSKLLMGKALLKTHTINNERFQYFGYFSAKNSMPVDDGSVISEFENSFHVARDNNSTGLSIVIPFPDTGINFDSALRAMIQHYFFPVLKGLLKLTIIDSERRENVDANNIVEQASLLNWKGTAWEEIDVRSILEFVRGSMNGCHPFQIEITDSENPEITPHYFGTQLNTIKNSFITGNPVKIKVSLRIRKKDGLERDTSFMVLIKRFPEFKRAFDCYIRAGILVTDIRALGNRPIAALLVAEDEPVCEFLGDCETPAHTNWNERTEGFSEKYENAVKTLRFIKKSVSQIVSILDEPHCGRQEDFLKEIFSIPAEPIEEEEEVKKKEEKFTSTPAIPPIKGENSLFNISRLEGGFSIMLNPERTDILPPFRATVRMAYDVRGANPFSHYEKFDFDVGSSSITTVQQDCNILNKSLNRLEFEVTKQNFRLEVTGFDLNRDLVVDIQEKR